MNYKSNIIDYIWYIGEALKKKDHNSMSGESVLLTVWLFGIFAPLILPLTYQFIGNPATMIIGILLIFFPFIFCKLRYTQYRKEEIFKHYSGLKSLYRRLFAILITTVLLTIVNFTLMYHLGFIVKKV